MKNFLTKCKIKKLQKKGLESYTITINGNVEEMVFYSPSRIYKYDKENFSY